MKTEFTIEIETPEGEYVEKAYVCEWAIEPAQKGGLIDPSWDAYPYLNAITDEAGKPVVETPAIIEAADEAMRDAFNDHNEHNDDHRDCYDDCYDDRD